MLCGLNHLTLAVTDLNRSIGFYHQLLQLRLDATWDGGAYLSLPGLWLCLSLDPLRSPEPAAEYTHYAFTADTGDFAALVARLRAAQVRGRWWRACALRRCGNGATTAVKARRSTFSTPMATSSKPTSAI